MIEIYRWGIVLAFILCFINPFASAQNDQNFPPAKIPPEVHAKKVNGEIKIDGKLNELAWQKAQAVVDFFKMEPRQGGRYSVFCLSYFQ